MLVRERMSHPVITCYPDTSLLEALDLMRRGKIRRLPVVDRKGDLVGIVSESALLRASPSEATSLSVYEIRDGLRKITVEKIMTHEVQTVEDSTPVEEAAAVMTDNSISGLPVLRDGKLVGLVTETDIFRTFAELLGAREPGVRLTVSVLKGPGQLAKITKAIYELGGDILALSTFLGETSTTGLITIKVDGVSKLDLTQAITPLVERIIDIREKKAN